jgi:NADPH:quinone reductase-like Zn-dependent oxidoreductase
MKAVQCLAFGKSDVIQLAEVNKPVISNENEVLIKVIATAVNPLDIKIRMGFMEKMYPITFPFTPGSEASGIVEAVGKNVTRLKVGDEVVASSMGGGSYAEYVLVKEDNVALKPNTVSFEEATSLVVAIGTTQSVLVDVAQIQQGQRLFIQGASGAVGSAMIQMAKAMGVYVIGTASGKGIDIIKNLGIDEAVDYKNQDFTALVKNVDVVVDCAGGPSQAKLFEVLKKGGKLLSITMPPSAELAQQFEVEARFVSSNLSHKNLAFGLQLVEQGKLKPAISQKFTLNEAAKAQDAVSAGGVNGKVVILVG